MRWQVRWKRPTWVQFRSIAIRGFALFGLGRDVLEAQMSFQNAFVYLAMLGLPNILAFDEKRNGEGK